MPRLELPAPPPPEKFTDEPWIEPDLRERAFTTEQRFQVRYEQDFLCAACGTACRGSHFKEPILSIHHVVPISRGGSNERDNAIGLCPKPCHDIFDYLALEQNTSALPILEAMGIPYEPQTIYQKALHEMDQLQAGHKHLRKGKKLKKPEEIKRHEERKKRNPDPRPPLPPQYQREIVSFQALSAAD